METAIRTILDTAVWAPSGDNSQPWSFAICKNIVRIRLDPERDNPILNFKLSGTYIAHGALIENIVLAAPLSGLCAEVQLLPDASDPYCTAEVIFHENSASPDPLAAVIRARHTNRKPYKSQSLPPGTFDAFRRASQSGRDTGLFLIDDKVAIRAVARASALMEQIALQTPELRRLFASDILWTDEENRSGKQGLYIKTMELPPPARLLMRGLRDPVFAKIAAALGFPHIARITDIGLYASAPAMGLVTIAEESPSAYLEAGRVFQRLWLEAASRGLAFHPVTGILFLARSVQGGEARGLLPRHFNAISSANTEIRKQFGAGENDIPAMLFRVGFANPATARSFRRPPIVHTQI